MHVTECFLLHTDSIARGYPCRSRGTGFSTFHSVCRNWSSDAFLERHQVCVPRRRVPVRCLLPTCSHCIIKSLFVNLAGRRRGRGAFFLPPLRAAAGPSHAFPTPAPPAGASRRVFPSRAGTACSDTPREGRQRSLSSCFLISAT